MPARKRGKKKKRNGQGNGSTNISSSNKQTTKAVSPDVLKRHWVPERWGIDKQSFMTLFQTTVISVLMVAAYAKTMQLDGLTAVTAMVLLIADVRASKEAAPTLKLNKFFALADNAKVLAFNYVLFPHHLLSVLHKELESEANAPGVSDAETNRENWIPKMTDNTTVDCVNMITERQSRCSSYEQELNAARPALVRAKVEAEAAVQQTENYAPTGAHVALASALSSAEDALKRNTEATMKLKQQVTCDKALLEALLTYDRAMIVWDHKTTPSEYDKQKALASFSKNDNHITIKEWKEKSPLFRYYTWESAQMKLYKILVTFLGHARLDISTAVASINQGLTLWNAIEKEMVPKTQAALMTRRTELNQMTMNDQELYAEYVYRVNTKIDEYNAQGGDTYSPDADDCPGGRARQILLTTAEHVHSRFKTELDMIRFAATAGLPHVPYNMQQIGRLFAQKEIKMKLHLKPTGARKPKRRQRGNNNEHGLNAQREKFSDKHSKRRDCKWCNKYRPKVTTLHMESDCFTKENQSNPRRSEYVVCDNCVDAGEGERAVGHSGVQCPFVHNKQRARPKSKAKHAAKNSSSSSSSTESDDDNDARARELDKRERAIAKEEKRQMKRKKSKAKSAKAKSAKAKAADKAPAAARSARKSRSRRQRRSDKAEEQRQWNPWDDTDSDDE